MPGESPGWDPPSHRAPPLIPVSTNFLPLSGLLPSFLPFFSIFHVSERCLCISVLPRDSVYFSVCLSVLFVCLSYLYLLPAFSFVSLCLGLSLCISLCLSCLLSDLFSLSLFPSPFLCLSVSSSLSSSLLPPTYLRHP